LKGGGALKMKGPARFAAPALILFLLFGCETEKLGPEIEKNFHGAVVLENENCLKNLLCLTSELGV